MNYKTPCTGGPVQHSPLKETKKFAALFCVNRAHRIVQSSFASAFAIALLLFFSACYEPSPLYGTWSDNQANKITFIADGTFIANIKNSVETPVSYEGSYTVIENILVFSTADGYSINTEWDIRGSILYLTWTGYDGVTKTLNMYHVSK